MLSFQSFLAFSAGAQHAVGDPPDRDGGAIVFQRVHFRSRIIASAHRSSGVVLALLSVILQAGPLS
jgi:hypothetical protein